MRLPVLLAVLLLSTTALAQTEPRHPISKSIPLDEIVKPSPRAETPNPIRPSVPSAGTTRSSRRPTAPPRVQDLYEPQPLTPIAPLEPTPSKVRRPKVPIGTIDPRPGTIRTHPGTIEAR
jgi:hypothetical protein